jgi:hypothetical protein
MNNVYNGTMAAPTLNGPTLTGTITTTLPAPIPVANGGTNYTFSAASPILTTSNNTSGSLTVQSDNAKFEIKSNKSSGWKCYMFGSYNSEGGSGIVWTPKEGELPNAFNRFMQYLFFKNVWVKED